jgi:hypothetical protein
MQFWECGSEFMTSYATMRWTYVLHSAASRWLLTVLSDCNTHVKHFTAECRNYLRLINTTPDTLKPVSQLLGIFRRLLFWTIVCNLSSAVNHYSNDWDIFKSDIFKSSRIKELIFIKTHVYVGRNIEILRPQENFSYAYDMLIISRKLWVVGHCTGT